MSDAVLVAYASRYGSTREVAEALARSLREEGVAVDLLQLREVRSLEGYRGVVMGAPIQMFLWHKDARAFLTRLRSALTGLPVAVFALGPFNDVEKEWKAVRGQLDKELAEFPWFSPVSVRIVGGKFDPARLRVPWILVPGIRKVPFADIRDWEDIAAWGRQLAGVFQPERA
jgi:menaquinone-dependent protoporphyrinogen oxidase